MHYGKTIIVTLIAALTLAASQMAQAQQVIFQQPPPSGPGWTGILGALGAAGGGVAGYNTSPTGFTGSQGGNTAAGAAIGLVSGLFIGSLIDSAQANVIGFGKSMDDLVCVHINQSTPVKLNGQILPPGNYCYCFYKSDQQAQAAKSKTRSSRTNLTDSEEVAISYSYRGKCNHDRVDLYRDLAKMPFAYENERCQTYGSNVPGYTEDFAIADCLAESSSCIKIK